MSKKNKHRTRKLAPATGWIIGGLVIALVIGGWVLIGNNTFSSGPRAISRLSTADFHSLAFSPNDPETVFFGHHNGLMISRDGGRNWQASPLQNADAMALAVSPANPQIMYAAGHNVFFKSTDGGQSWQPMATNLPGLDIHGFTVDPQNTDTAFAHVVGFPGVFRSEDGGFSWAALPAAMPLSTFNLIAGEDAKTLYAAAGSAGLWRSVDGGESWAQLTGAPGNAIVALAYNPLNKRLFSTAFGEGAGLYASDDGGDTWIALGLKGNLMAIASSPHDPNHLIAVDEKGWVYASRDGGVTWPGQ